MCYAGGTCQPLAPAGVLVLRYYCYNTNDSRFPLATSKSHFWAPAHDTPTIWGCLCCLTVGAAFHASSVMLWAMHCATLGSCIGLGVALLYLRLCLSSRAARLNKEGLQATLMLLQGFSRGVSSPAAVQATAGTFTSWSWTTGCSGATTQRAPP